MEVKQQEGEEGESRKAKGRMGPLPQDCMGAGAGKAWGAGTNGRGQKAANRLPHHLPPYNSMGGQPSNNQILYMENCNKFLNFSCIKSNY